MAIILLVDNDPLQAYFRKSNLEARFPDVQRVADAAEALCLVEQPQFAAKLGLVISDHHLPGIGGPMFAAELHIRMPWVPVLVLGAAGETEEDYAESGACFHSSPVTTKELLSLAEKIIAECKRKTA
jgi:CheY-like chemotaxis protein